MSLEQNQAQNQEPPQLLSLAEFELLEKIKEVAGLSDEELSLFFGRMVAVGALPALTLAATGVTIGGENRHAAGQGQAQAPGNLTSAQTWVETGSSPFFDLLTKEIADTFGRALDAHHRLLMAHLERKISEGTVTKELAAQAQAQFEPKIETARVWLTGYDIWLTGHTESV